MLRADKMVVLLPLTFAVPVGADIITPAPVSSQSPGSLDRATEPRTSRKGATKEIYEPMLSLYRPARVLPAIRAQLRDGQHGLQRLFVHGALTGPVVRLPRDPFTSALQDWDTPEDMRRHQSGESSLDANDA